MAELSVYEPADIEILRGRVKILHGGIKGRRCKAICCI